MSVQIKIPEEYIEKARQQVLRLQDVRIAGQVLFVVIILLISWSGIKAIQTNYGLQKQISALNQQNSVQKLSNDNLALQNQYYKSNQYLELSARQNFGLATPGEKEVVVPANVALSYTVNLPVDHSTDIPQPKQSALQQHINSWLNFFLHRH